MAQNLKISSLQEFTMNSQLLRILLCLYFSSWWYWTLLSCVSTSELVLKNKSSLNWELKFYKIWWQNTYELKIMYQKLNWWIHNQLLCDHPCEIWQQIDQISLCGDPKQDLMKIGALHRISTHVLYTLTLTRFHHFWH